MNHTFLVEPGRWILQGNWLERDKPPMVLRGGILIAWGRDNWFTMVMKLTFPNQDHDEISLQYKGRLAGGERQYTFVLQHSELGRVEGEGWVAPASVMQRYWCLGDRQRRTGFETLFQVDEQRYHLSSGIMAGHYLTTAIEANLERQ